MIWKIKDGRIDCDRPCLMGILNLTPDSFSDGGVFLEPAKAVEQGLRMAEEGAEILDLGGESTRPGARPVSEREELARVLPVLRRLRQKIPTPLSVDTTKPEVARACLEEGAAIINDVSGLVDSGEAMARLVRDAGAGLVLMHRLGTPETMQSLARYDNVVEEVFQGLCERLRFALACGVSQDQIVLDPGLGFAKDFEQNLELVRHLDRFREIGLPLLIGPSRKSFIGRLTGRAVGERDYGTAAVVAISVLRGAQILRVHHVRVMRDVVKVAEAVKKGVSHVGTFKVGEY